MTCAECVKQLLESGREEIVRADSSELGRHLMTCPRCRAVADGILGQTAGVTRLLGAERSKRKKKRGVAATAGIAICLLAGSVTLRSAVRHDVPTMPTKMRVDAAPVVRAVATWAPDKKPLGVQVFAHPIVAHPIAPVVALGSMPEPATEAPSHDSEVAVSPPAGVRAAVIRTRDPKITVVWLY
jgi:hypothetical protein